MANIEYFKEMYLIISIVIWLLPATLETTIHFTLRSQLDSKMLEALDSAEKELSDEFLRVKETTKLGSLTAMELKPLYFHVDDLAVQVMDMQLTCNEPLVEESNLDVLGHRMVPIVTFLWAEVRGKLKAGLNNNVPDKFEFSLVQERLKGKGVVSLTVDLVNVTWSHIYFRPNSSSFEIKSTQDSVDPSLYKILNSTKFCDLLNHKLQRDISYQLTGVVTKSIKENLRSSSKLKNLQPYSEEISTIGINNTENANMFIDNILKVGGAMIQQKFGDRIRIPDIEEGFATKLYYGRYEAKMWSVGPSGSLDTSLAPVSVLAHVHLNTSSKMVSLNKFKIISVGDLAVSLTGLGGMMDWLVSRVTTWVVGMYRDQVLQLLESQYQQYARDVFNTYTLEELLNGGKNENFVMK